MNCMKCGRELDSEQAFCDDCLLEMKKYPVPSGTAVQLPLWARTTPPKKSQPRRRTISLEEQVKILKKRIWVLAGALTVTIALILALIYPAVNYFLKSYYLRPGQNYTTVVSTTAATEETVGETQG